jgi:hypothetical protein
MRSGFQALMRDALNRRFDVVLAGDQEDTAGLFKRLTLQRRGRRNPPTSPCKYLWLRGHATIPQSVKGCATAFGGPRLESYLVRDTAIRLPAERTYITPSAIAGVAISRSPIANDPSFLNSRPAASTVMSPSSPER